MNNESISPLWRKIWRQREESMQDVFARNMEKIQKSSRSLKPLDVGQYVVLQNQNGPHPLRWDRTGQVVEYKDYDQYLVKIHGSNRLTLRNRRFLRAYDPPASIDERLLSSPNLEDQEYPMNTGAGKQTRPVDDVHFSIPGHGGPEPRVVSEPNVGVPSAPISEPVTHDVNLAVDPIRPASQVSSPEQEAGVRRSSRANKGKTSVFKDYLTEDEIGML